MDKRVQLKNDSNDNFPLKEDGGRHYRRKRKMDLKRGRVRDLTEGGKEGLGNSQ